MDNQTGLPQVFPLSRLCFSGKQVQQNQVKHVYLMWYRRVGNPTTGNCRIGRIRNPDFWPCTHARLKHWVTSEQYAPGPNTP